MPFRIKLVAALCIWTIIVLMFWFWYFEIFNTINTTNILDSKDALSRINLLKRHLSYYLFLLLFLSTCAIWIASFWKKRLILIISSIGVIIGIFFLLYGLSLGSGCEGLGCIGAGIPFLFGLAVLSIIAFSLPFVFILLKRFASPAFIRAVSAGLLVTLSFLGMIFFAVVSRNLQIAGKENFTKLLTEWSETNLFEPEYLPLGAEKKTEDSFKERYYNPDPDKIPQSSKYQFELYQFYSLPLPEDFNPNLVPDYVEIEQFKALKSFEQYYKEYYKRYEGSGATWIEDEILVNSSKTKAVVSVWSFPGVIGGGKAELFLIKDGTAIGVFVNCSASCNDARREAVTISESLRPKSKSFFPQSSF